MVSYGSSRGGGGSSTPVFKYLPGQEALAGQMVGQFQDIFSGNMASPTARAMQTVVGEAGMRESAQERRRIAETRGMSTPARQQAIGKAGEGAVSTMARVPQEMWQKAAEFLTTYSMQAPAVGQVSEQAGTKSSSYGCCFIFLEGKMLNDTVRRYRDEHFPKLISPVALGYRWMASWLVPLMKKSKLIKWIVKMIMLNPLAYYAAWYYNKNSVGWIFIPFRVFWVKAWWFFGRMEGQIKW